MVADFESDLMRMRAREWMQVAKAKGRLKGKQPKLRPNQARDLVELHDLGTYTQAELVELSASVDQRSTTPWNEDVRRADGSRLTETAAQDLANEVVRASGRGRPSLTAPGERSPQLRLSVPEQLREGLRARANAEHRSVSEPAREAIERYLAS